MMIQTKSQSVFLLAMPHIVLFLFVSLGIPSQYSYAQQPDADNPETSQSSPENAEKDQTPSIRLPRQPGDAIVEPLPDGQQRSEQDAKKADAMSWFLAGRIYERRNNLKKAYNAYSKSIELNPDSFPVYRAMVPLTLAMGLKDEAIKFMRKAVELNPDDFQLLWQLAQHEINQNNLEGSIKYLEQTRDAGDLDKKSAIYVTIQQQLAELYRIAGRAKDAAESYKVVFDAMINPANYNLSFQLRNRLRNNASSKFESMGQVFLVAEDYELARKAFEESARTTRKDREVLGYNLARIFVKQKQFEKALPELQKYLDAKISSKGRAPYVLLAEIFNSTNRKTELLPTVEKLAAEDLENDELHFFLADQLVEASRLDEAQKIYEDRLENAKSDAGYIGLIRVYRMRSQAEKLIDILGTALGKGANPLIVEAELELIGKDANLVKSLFEVGRKRLNDEQNDLDFAKSLILGQIAIQADDADAALEFYQAAITRQKRPSLSLYRGIALFLLEKDRYSEGIEILQQAVEEPTFEAQKPTLLYLLSQAQELNGQTDSALSNIRQARSIDPENAAWHYHEGWIFAHSRQNEKAVETFNQIIDQYKGAEDKAIVRQAQFNLSAVYVQMGDFENGEKVLEVVFAEEPENISVNNDLGYLYADQGKKLEQAKSMIEKALKSEPENAAYLDSMGWVLYRLDQPKKALKFLKDAVKNRKSGDAVIHDHLGDCYAKLDENDKAIKHWKEALKQTQDAKYPDEKLVKALQEKLKKVGAEAAEPKSAPK